MCGTYGGYQQHKLNKEDACDLCVKAHREYKRQNYLNSLERNKARLKKYRDSDKGQDNGRKYRKTNADKLRIYYLEKERRRRARKLNNLVIAYKETEVLETYGTDCHICTKPIDLNAPRKVGKDNWQYGLHIDHIIPISKGGADTLENVRPAHAICNVSKGGK